MYELSVEDSFDAAHALRGYEGPCENLHGHTWRVKIQVQGKKLNKLGLLEDFKNLKKHLKAVVDIFDHKLINDLTLFKKENPSSENLARIIYNLLKKKIKGLSRVTVFESPLTSATYWEE